MKPAGHDSPFIQEQQRDCKKNHLPFGGLFFFLHEALVAGEFSWPHFLMCTSFFVLQFSSKAAVSQIRLQLFFRAATISRLIDQSIERKRK